MKTKALVVFLSILLIFSLSRQVSAEKLVEKDPIQNNSTSSEIEAKKLDNKAKILSEYLANFDSPLQYHAQDFIDAADSYGLDWKLIPAIAGVESTFGKHIPGGFNAWGWGVYGTQAIYFNSWRDGIFTLAKGLREGYLDKGLNDPYSMNRVYAASPFWGGKVSYFMQDLQSFADKFEANTTQVSQIGKDPIVAAVSGQLALR
ncbi:hypothetical protein M1437_04495 [Patescibacteria group bacterium]|nr:hypothetical protein [Patescibacteria group bacterium]